MRILLFAAAILLPMAAGLAYAGTQEKAEPKAQNGGYLCPATGEVLPCPSCCQYK